MRGYYVMSLHYKSLLVVLTALWLCGSKYKEAIEQAGVSE